MMHTIDTNWLRNHILHQLGQGATALDAARNWMAAHGIDVDISPADVEPRMKTELPAHRVHPAVGRTGIEGRHGCRPPGRSG